MSVSPPGHREFPDLQPFKGYVTLSWSLSHFLKFEGPRVTSDVVIDPPINHLTTSLREALYPGLQR